MEIAGRPVLRPPHWDMMRNESGPRAKESRVDARVASVMDQIQAARIDTSRSLRYRTQSAQDAQTAVGIDPGRGEAGPSYYEIVEALYKAADASQAKLSKPPLTALSVYSALMEDVGDFTALLGPSQSAGSDANHIKFDVRAVKAKLEAMLKKWSNETVYGPAPIEEIKRLAQQWRLPYRDLGNGTGVVGVNVKPIETMLKDLQDEQPGEDGKVDWMMGRYNAWNVTMTAQCEQIQGEFRLLSDLARNGLTQSNALLEALSATITSNRESCLQYARGLA